MQSDTFLSNYLDTEIIFQDTADFSKCFQNNLPGAVEHIEMLNNLLNNEKEQVFFDIGANIGTFSMMAKVNQKLKVFAIEPVSRTFNVLKKNIELNNLQKQVNLVQTVFSDNLDIKTMDIRIPMNEQYGLVTLGDKPLRFEEYITEIVNNTTLDKFCEENGITHIDMIKIDTEGYETFILKGGKNIISKCHPILFCEFNQMNATQCGSSLKELLNTIKSLGYNNIRQIHNDDILCTIE